MQLDFPFLQSSNPLLWGAYRVAAGDLAGNIALFQDGLLERPAPCILAGLEYQTPWTRDTAINIWNGAGLLAPEAARNTLLAVLEKSPVGDVRIGGQYWDAIIWVVGAWQYYLFTGDRALLQLAREAARSSFAWFEAEEFDPAWGLFRGPAVYGDGVASYPDEYAATDGSSSILDWPAANPTRAARPGFGLPMMALSTNCTYAQAYALMGQVEAQFGGDPHPWLTKAAAVRSAVRQHFWDAEHSTFRYLVDAGGGCAHQEGMGHALALLFGVASSEQAAGVLREQFISPAGIPCVWPTFRRYSIYGADVFGRHSGTVWPHIQGLWAEAALRHGRADLFDHELTQLARCAVRDGHFAEIYHPFTGEIYGGAQEGGSGPDEIDWHSCRRQTWSATAFLRLVLYGLAGMDFGLDGVRLRPYLPAQLGGVPTGEVQLSGILYRGARLNLRLSGQGQSIRACRVNGAALPEPQAAEGCFVAADTTGEVNIEIQLGAS